MKLIYSDNFISILKNSMYDSIYTSITSSLSSILHNIQGLDSEISYIDIDNGFITYLTQNSVNKNKFSEKEMFFNVNLRSKMKIGRFIRKVLSNKKYNNLTSYFKIFTDNEIESFTNHLKSESSDLENERFILVEGDDIEKYYDLSVNRRGTLGGSCMSGKSKKIKGIFDIYTKNKEVCNLLVLLDRNGIILGRSIIWKAKIEKGEHDLPNNIFLMDRVYHRSDYIYNKFKKYSIDNEYMYKFTNGITNSNVEFIYKSILYSNLELSINIKKVKYRKYPYLDTFKIYDNIKGKLSTQTSNSPNRILLCDTGGGCVNNGNLIFKIRSLLFKLTRMIK